MIGYFRTEPLAQVWDNNTAFLPLELDTLATGELPQTQVVLLPEYHSMDEDARPADLNTMLVGINEVIYPDLDRLPDGCFYYNGWPVPGVPKTLALEVVAPAPTLALLARLLEPMGVQLMAAPATPGMISARVIAMIINEAHLLLQEGAASAEDIDLSMKLGTGYPMGPFAWEQLWGVEKTRALLGAMAEREPEVVLPYMA